MKFISWNIDSLNAALTSDSNRAKMSRDVLNTIIDENTDIICLQETNYQGQVLVKNTKKYYKSIFQNMIILE